MYLSENGQYITIEEASEKGVMDYLVERGILKEAGGSWYTISDALFNNLRYDCLNDAEYIMGLYNGKTLSGEVVSCTVEGAGDIGDTYERNGENVNSVSQNYNENAFPGPGNAYFICRTEAPYAPEGEFPYHAAAVIIQSGGGNFTLETWSDIDEYGEEIGCWSFDRYGGGNDSFHARRKADFKNISVKTVAIRLK